LAVEEPPDHVAGDVDRGEGECVHAAFVAAYSPLAGTAVMSLVTEDMLTIDPHPAPASRESRA
jgi:hypothetical protein